MTDRLTVEEVFHHKEATLGLELLNPTVSLDRAITDPDVSGPGLALSGYLERFPADRIQVFGQTEMTYLARLEPDVARQRLEAIFSLGIPAAIVTKGQNVPDAYLQAASIHGIPVLRSEQSTKVVYRRLKPFLERALAPATTLHGSLADVYGVGLLFRGPSGVGKSECVLDLVERGHRLVADDLVRVTRVGNDILIGRGSDLQGHHMEIRGVGIVDVQALFGIRAIRQQKRIEVVVQLEHWDDDAVYERTGLTTSEAEILGVRVPELTIPLNPGKNITVISEVVAMNHLLKYAGIDSAALLDARVKAAMRPVREYLEEDVE